MRKHASNLEWQIVECDADWERLHNSPRPDITSDPLHGLRLQRALATAVVLLLLLAATGRWWQSFHARVHPTEADVKAAAQRELRAVAPDDPLATGSPADQQSMAWWDQRGRTVSSLLATVQIADPKTQQDIKLHTVEVQGEQAVVSIVTSTQDGAPLYRQMRFYRRIGPDWRQTAPEAALWGPERSLETPSFVFHFRQHDAPAVIAVAPQMDTLVRIMRRNFGLPIALGGSPLPAMFGGEKLVIEVSVTQTPADRLAWFRLPGPLTVPSPAVYRAPVELGDDDLLAQSIALPLSEQVVAQARERHAIGQHWQPLVKGLHLWQVWDMDLPLAAWREQVVKWIYVDGPALGLRQTFVLPVRYRELCAAHLLWLLSPAQLNIPLTCVSPEAEEPSFPLWRLRDSLTRLDQLGVPLRPGAYSEELDPLHPVVPHPGQTVALATLIEYAVATYGRERLPTLVAGLGQHDSWDTLIPAVYGVSPAEFEAGWRTYLADRYAVPLPTSRLTID